MATIVIDPGHGGTTAVGGSSANNARGPSGLLEKTATLDVAKRMAKALENAGHTVVLTRTADTNLGLSARAAVAKSIKAPVFVSIHFNGLNGVVQGTETFCHTDHAARSADLCRDVQAAAVAATALRDRNQGAPGGVKTLGLGVLRRSSHHANTACVLVEVSFMDVPAEDARLHTAAYKDRVAGGLATGVINYLNGIALGAAQAATAAADVEDAFVSLNAPAALAAAAPAAKPKKPKKPGRSTPKAGKAPKPDAERSSGIDADEQDDSPAAGAVALEAAAAPAATPANFQAFVDGLGLRYFSAAELLEMGGSNGSGTCAGRNVAPPAALWPNIAATARMLDEIRHRLGYAVRINSAYRAPPYNTCIGGEAGSLHMRFNAIDFRGSEDSSATWWAVAKSVRLSDPAFRGGIGYYKALNFVHIDTRGSNANWRGSGD